uniref:Putative secreted peptide n=1 Tax=Anopheles braziliensis TaxID=58242 RepID=A0A2M3ZY52_9DIPT
MRRGLRGLWSIGLPLCIQIMFGLGSPAASHRNSAVSPSAAFTISGSTVKYGTAFTARLIEYESALPTPFDTSHVYVPASSDETRRILSDLP